MIDLLKDIITHTHNLGFLDVVKITGDDSSTTIDSIAADNSVIMSGKFHNAVPEFHGVFGMPQLSKLKIHLDCPLYKDNATVTIATGSRNGQEVLTGLHFVNADGDFKNDYRFMSTEIINERLKIPVFRGANWDVTVVPTLAVIQRFAFQTQANNEHKTFITKTDGDKLIFMFGDQASHGGEFVFSSNITGRLTKTLSWPVAQVLSILKLSADNDTKISISNLGVMMITVESAFATYKYMIPANI